MAEDLLMHARTLERELIAAKKEVEELRKRVAAYESDIRTSNSKRDLYREDAIRLADAIESIQDWKGTEVGKALSLTPADASKMFVPVESVEKLCEEVAYMATEMHDSDDEEDKRLALGWMKLVGAIRKRYVTSPPAPPSAHPAGPVPPP